MHKHPNPYFENLFPKYSCGFSKCYDTQQCLVSMIEKQRATLDKGGISALLLTDIWKPFDCHLHDLLIAKRHRYETELSSVRLLYSYFVKWKQRIWLANSYN